MFEVFATGCYGHNYIDSVSNIIKYAIGVFVYRKVMDYYDLLIIIFTNSRDRWAIILIIGTIGRV